MTLPLPVKGRLYFHSLLLLRIFSSLFDILRPPPDDWYEFRSVPISDSSRARVARVGFEVVTRSAIERVPHVSAQPETGDRISPILFSPSEYWT